jgi:hypothetical protein
MLFIGGLPISILSGGGCGGQGGAASVSGGDEELRVQVPVSRITVNLAPAIRKKRDGFDLRGFGYSGWLRGYRSQSRKTALFWGAVPVRRAAAGDGDVPMAIARSGRALISVGPATTPPRRLAVGVTVILFQCQSVIESSGRHGALHAVAPSEPVPCTRKRWIFPRSRGRRTSSAR